VRKKIVRIVLPVAVAGSLIAGVGVQSASAAIPPHHYKHTVVLDTFFAHGTLYKVKKTQNCTITYDRKGHGTKKCGPYGTPYIVKG
jgi:hypothetical protein